MLESVFPGDSEMARRMRALDWSKTSFGPVERWPQALRTSVSVALNCAFPIIIWWGPDLAILYNDEYRAMLGPAKHPAALGERGARVWAEIWDIIGPMLSHVMGDAGATRSRDLLLHIDRGYPEEAYFSFSYSPIHDDDGRVGGVFCPVIETTEKVIGERRLRTLRDLAAKCKGAESEDSAYGAAAGVLAANPHDVPFAMIYRIDESQALARLEATAGIEPATPASPRSVTLAEDGAGVWSLSAVARSGRSAPITGLSAQFRDLPLGAWKVPAHSAVVLPILLPGQDHPRAILVAAVSPMRALDEDYRTFFELIATQIAAGLADAQALEEERRRAEALAEIDRAKTAFFSNVSHEFRTPLTLMLAPVEDALNDGDHPLPFVHRDRLETAHRNSLRLLKLVNTLLDFSRIEAGRVQAVYEPTDLGPLTAELASNFRSACERAGLALVIDCPPSPEPIYVDRDMWEKIVLNLMSNAFKFTFAGEIAVALRVVDGGVELTVRDTGTGIPPEELPRIFDRFHRIQGSRGRTHEGTGIGLALVQELVKLHGGSVRAESAVGKGSRFTVSIPAGRAHLPADRIGAARTLATTALGAEPYVEEALRWLPDAEPVGASPLGVGGGLDAELARAAPAPPRGHDGAAQRARIVWADDNADMREYVRRLLAAHYEVEAVPDGLSALAAARARRPDLVLADIMMPRLDGLGLLRALRGDADLRTVPAILLSARAGEEARIEGLEAGADDYLIKPFSARELVARVAAHLEIAAMRKQVEDALRDADRRKDEFLATLSHELRTPLNAMLGWTRMLRSGVLDPATAGRALDVIERSVDHQSRLITDLLDVSRIISGKLTLEIGVVDLANIVTSVVDTMRPTADAAALALTASVPKNAVPVHGDAERLRQVLSNLLSNAIKFTPGGGRVSVRLEQVGERARLEVSDTGQGIAAGFLPHLFERFRQADSSTTRAKVGLGLGLAIAQHLVELHQGRVRVQTGGEGCGATFTVELPIAAATPDRQLAPPALGDGSGDARAALAGIRVLVVDDDRDSHELYRAVLSRHGAQVTTAGTVGDALAAARRDRPDVVISDVAMPGEDGFALIRQIRSWSRDEGGAVPAIALTAYARPEERQRILAAGFQWHLSKPVEPRAMYEAVARLAPR